MDSGLGVIDEDANWASVQAVATDKSASASLGPGESSTSTRAGGAGMGIKPVQQMSLWNSWPTSDPPQYDAGVRAG